MNRFGVRTRSRTEFLEITGQVRAAMKDSGVQDGLCVVFVPHTTAGVTIQENADPDVTHDLKLWLDRHIPKELPGFRHAEGNSDSHLKASFFGSSVTVVIAGGDLLFGTWQGIYLCEFDGPRDRNIVVQCVGS